MEFEELQESLRDTERDALLAYDGARDPLGRPNACCYGSWSIYRHDGRVQVSQYELRRRLPDGSASPVWDFDDDSAACGFLRDRIEADCPPRSVWPVHWQELPERLRDWLTGAGWTGATTLFGNPLVATRGDQSYRLLQLQNTFELRTFDHRVPKNQPGISATDLDLLFRCLLVKAGPPPGLRRLGWPRVGCPWPAGGGVPELLRTATLDELADAYAERDGGILEVLAQGVRLDLVTDDLRALAASAGVELMEFGDGDSASFALSFPEFLQLSTENDKYRLTYIGERGNRRVLVESDRLVAVQSRLVEELHHLPAVDPAPAPRTEHPTPPIGRRPPVPRRPTTVSKVEPLTGTPALTVARDIAEATLAVGAGRPWTALRYWFSEIDGQRTSALAAQRWGAARWRLAPPADDEWSRLRAMMADPTNGTWLSAAMVIDADGVARLEFNHDLRVMYARVERPLWVGYAEPPDARYRADLRRFPRAAGRLPAWYPLPGSDEDALVRAIRADVPLTGWTPDPWAQVYRIVRREVTRQLSAGGEHIPSLPAFAMDPPPEHLDHGVSELLDWCGPAFTDGLLAQLESLGHDRLSEAARHALGWRAGSSVPGRPSALLAVLVRLILHDLGGRFGVIPA